MDNFKILEISWTLFENIVTPKLNWKNITQFCQDLGPVSK